MRTGTTTNWIRALICAAAVFASPVGEASASPIVINFDPGGVPSLGVGPSVFTQGDPAQTITVPGVATFTGGVILGNELNLPAQSFGTGPNVYGTAGFDSVLSSTLTMTFGLGLLVDEVSFPLFNGSTTTESYVAQAFNGATLVASQTLSAVPSNSDSGFGIFDLTAANITSVTINPLALDAACCNGWDYSIDSVALNESVQQAFATPEPASMALLGSGLIVLLGRGRRRKL